MRVGQTVEADDAAVLTKAFLNTGKAMGLNQAELGEIVGRDRTSLRRGLSPASKAGELALLLIRVYRSLYVLVGGDLNEIRHWMSVHNHHTGGIPREQVKSVQGLTRIVEYVDGMRGKL
jgi:hypothetical protein